MISDPRDLQPGDWIDLEFGFAVRPMYVLENDGAGITYGSPNWVVSSCEYNEYKNMKRWRYLGRGQRRWWWRFLPWRDLVVPFSKPESLWWL